MNKNVYTGKFFEVRRHKRMHVRKCRGQLEAYGTKWAGHSTYIDSNKVLAPVCKILDENHDKVLVRGNGSYYWLKSFYLGEEVMSPKGGADEQMKAACAIVETYARSIGKNCQIIFAKGEVEIAPLSASGSVSAKTLYDALKEAETSFDNE